MLPRTSATPGARFQAVHSRAFRISVSPALPRRRRRTIKIARVARASRGTIRTDTRIHNTNDMRPGPRVQRSPHRGASAPANGCGRHAPPFVGRYQRVCALRRWRSRLQSAPNVHPPLEKSAPKSEKRSRLPSDFGSDFVSSAPLNDSPVHERFRALTTAAKPSQAPP